MARQTVIHLVDDVDGEPADETVRLELDRRGYEIDLSRENAARLRAQLEPWIAAARRTSGRRRRSR
ncbi:histone-like nucleoid-structuring protein Lsr2 [Terrabacter sp. MAHUQ-38]|uniref:Lsr2 dimerization domain-containing protein n=1 Tax=unclassified Terrabacter TaxID=2630222 RepID=UPI00165EA80B|nr:histone-like nucleoid-structuring protein Lsr2 [Terrabacter sp. MAHUQ-38]MBC9819704.1 Lsr2 family protein [Terrabacter sp. MAHUQ-38]